MYWNYLTDLKKINSESIRIAGVGVVNDQMFKLKVGRHNVYITFIKPIFRCIKRNDSGRRFFYTLKYMFNRHL